MNAEIVKLDTSKIKTSSGTIIFSIMYIAMALSSFCFNSTIFEYIPFWLVAYVPHIIFYTLGVIKIAFIDKHDKKEWLIISIGFLLSIIMLIASNHEVAILFFYFGVFAAKDIDFNQFLKYFFSIILSVFVINTTLAFLGIIPDLVYGKRHSFGISYPTDFAAYIFYLFLIYSCLIKRHNIVYILIGLCLAFFVLHFSVARLDFGMILITLICFVVNDYFKQFYTIKPIKTLIIYSSVILCFIAFTLSLAYSSDNSILEFINNLFSGRFYLSNKAFEILPISLFGTPFSMYGFGGMNPLLATNEYFFLDILYIQLFFRYGIIGFTIIIGSLFFSEVEAYKENNIIIVIAFLMLAITSFVDHHLIELSYNPFYAYTGVMFYKRLNNRNKTN